MVQKDVLEILAKEGFEFIGFVNLKQGIYIFWDRQRYINLEAFLLDGNRYLLRASKPYRFCSINAEGESFLRNIAESDSYLRRHFDEMNIVCSVDRHPVRSLIHNRLAHKNLGVKIDLYCAEESKDKDGPSSEIEKEKKEIAQNEMLYSTAETEQAKRLLKSEIIDSRQRLNEIRKIRKLEDQYARKSEALALLFVVTSDMQLASCIDQFGVALDAVCTEIQNIHKFKISQKFGGKLKINIEEVDAPCLSLLGRWTGALVRPDLLEQLGDDFIDLREEAEKDYTVYPFKDILLDNAVRDQKKRLGAQFVRTFLKNLPKASTHQSKSIKYPRSKTPIWIGKNCEDNSICQYCIGDAGHTLISGATGCGKTCLLGTMVEGYFAYENLHIIVIDSTGHLSGMFLPQNKTDVLARFKDFHLQPEDSRGLPFLYHTVCGSVGERLPDNLSELAFGKRLISLQGLGIEDQRSTVKSTLDVIFECRCNTESETASQVIFIDEVHRFTRGDSLRSLCNIIREGRKYGLYLILATHRVRDFSHEGALIRSNTSKIFMRNFDVEAAYGLEFGISPQEITGLKQGQAILVGPEIGQVKVNVRPPLAMIGKLSESRLAEFVGTRESPAPIISDTGLKILDLVKEHYQKAGLGLRLTDIGEQLGITSHRRMQSAVQELEKASLIRSQRLHERGRPMVIYPFNHTD